MSTPQSTPQSTPPSTPRGPVRSAEEYFNSSRLKVIGLITAATVAVGALGGIAGVVFDPEPVKDNVIQPGDSEGVRIGPQSLGGPLDESLGRSLGSPGTSSPHGSARSPFASRLVSDDDPSSSPTSVGSLSPGTGGISDSPSDDATEDSTGLPTEESTGTDGGDTCQDECGVVIDSTGVGVYVPQGWKVDFTDDNRVFQSDGNGSFSFAFSYADDPSTAAGDVITQNLEGLLPPENYTQRQTSDVVPLNPFGSVVSIAAIEYEALWVDNQGSASIHGQIYVGVRQDGTVLGILVEHIPAEDFVDSFEDLSPILDRSFNRFAGLE